MNVQNFRYIQEFAISSRTLLILFLSLFLFWVFFFKYKFFTNDNMAVEKTTEHVFDFRFAHSCFLRERSIFVCHFALRRFVLWSYLKTHDSSPVFTRLKKFPSLLMRSRRSWYIFIRVSFCWSVIFFGTNFAQIFRMFLSWNVNGLVIQI